MRPPAAEWQLTQYVCIIGWISLAKDTEFPVGTQSLAVVVVGVVGFVVGVDVENGEGKGEGCGEGNGEGCGVVLSWYGMPELTHC